MMTRTKGWIKPLLVLAVGTLVPFLGFLVVLGYALEWARLSAWRVDASPKQRDVRVGACLSSGWRGFVVLLAWMLVWSVFVSLVLGLVRSIVGNGFTGIFEAALLAVGMFYGAVAYAAALRAAIYEKIGAGLNVRRVLDMVRRDSNGLFKTVLIVFVGEIIIMAIVWAGAIVFFGLEAKEIMDFAWLVVSSPDNSAVAAEALYLAGNLLRVLVPILIVFGFPVALVNVACTLLQTNAIGLWMSQFDVAKWGTSSDPLPATAGLPAAKSPRDPAGVDE